MVCRIVLGFALCSIVGCGGEPNAGPTGEDGGAVRDGGRGDVSLGGGGGGGGSDGGGAGSGSGGADASVGGSGNGAGQGGHAGAGGDASVQPPVDPTRPNVIIILADDLGYGDLETYNPSSKIPTPHLNVLASEGLRFEDAHSPSAICTPTRYAIMTGRYAWRTRLSRFVLAPYDLPLIERGRLTLPRFLGRVGYRTALIGKWHLGTRWPTIPEDNYRSYELRQERSLDLGGRLLEGPLTAGFEHFFGVDAPDYPPYAFVEDDRIVGAVPTILKPDDELGREGLMQPGWSPKALLPTLASRAVTYIRDQASSGNSEPFFLYMPLTGPHVPIVPNDPFVGTSQAGAYGDFVAEMDDLVGQIMAAIDENGLAANTLLLFASDNGSPGRDGNGAGVGTVNATHGHSVNGTLRGFKGDSWEGGHRIPLIARWPAVISPGATTDVTVSLVDILATVADIVDEAVPDFAAQDSFSFWPVLQGSASSGPSRPNIVTHSSFGVFSLRFGEWKLIMGDGSGGFSLPRGNVLPAGPGQLYDLALDLGESDDRYAPDPGTVGTLLPILEQFRATRRSVPPRDSDGDGVSDWNERRAGTDPRDAASSVAFTEVVLDVVEFQVVGSTGTANTPAATGSWGTSSLYVRERHPTDAAQSFRSRLFLRFDTSLVPAGTVLSARLRLHQNHRLNTAGAQFPAQIAVSRVSEAWGSAAGSYPRFFDTVVADELVIGSNEDFGTQADAAGFYSGDIRAAGDDAGVDVTSVVLPWFEEQQPDHGLRIRLDDRNSRGASFSEADIPATPANEAPQLILTVAVPGP